jgi:CheY-like chemotaxis protein
MSQATIDRAFEPFFTTKPKGQGTGLGLATIYGIVTQAGGTAHIYSEPGIGTTITALLPATTRSAVAGGPAADEIIPGRGETILVVEDEVHLRGLIERILHRHNYNVLTAEDGVAAVELAAGRPDIDRLLTDVVMPNMAGQELANRLRETHPEMPVVYVSGYAEPILTTHKTLPHGVTLAHQAGDRATAAAGHPRCPRHRARSGGQPRRGVVPVTFRNRG